jgi:3-oxoacyl-[acyl-carrier-protein] synthase I
MNTYLSAMAVVNALGSNPTEVCERLFAGDARGIVSETGWLPDRPAYVGKVQAALPELPEAFAKYRCRNNRLLLAALAQIENEVQALLHRHGPARIAIVLGTSTSGIAEGEAAIARHVREGALPAEYDYAQQEFGSPAVFLAHYLGITGPAYAVSTACTSSAKVLASARRLLQVGLCDAAIVGGVDTLCRLTLNGFHALESISPEPCNPLSRNRRGITIGEGAALFILGSEEADIALLGIGESSDAHHISAPDPEGAGAEAAMRGALRDAQLAPEQIDYLNLHATATLKNDEMESRTVARIFPEGVWTSGTKGLTGHCLGAAGAVELAFCWLALRERRLPPHVWDGETDPALPALRLVGPDARLPEGSRRTCMSNSFAFGGNNISVLIGDAR